MSIYLKIPGIDGDCILPEHEGEMELSSFANGVSHMHNPAEASSQVTGLVTAHPISVTKFVDRSTPEMIQACCDGKVFEEPIIITHTKKIDQETVDFFKLTLTEAQIIDDQITSDQSGVPLESISIGYGEIEWEYENYTKGGQSEGTITANYNMLEQRGA